MERNSLDMTRQPQISRQVKPSKAIPPLKASKTAKKKSIRELKKELWRIFSKWIRARDKNICYTCGRPGNEAGHYYHSKGFLIHFDPRAVHVQCPMCNRWKSGNLQEYALRLLGDYGPEILEEFNMLRNTNYKPTREEYQKKIDYYKLNTLSIDK